MSYEKYLKVDILNENTRHFEIKDEDGLSFKNIQFSNDAFKKISGMKGFRAVDGGLGFYFKENDTSFAIRKVSKQKFKEESLILRELFYDAAKFIDENINVNVSKNKVCPLCGYDEFDYVNISGHGTAAVSLYIKENEDAYARIEFCKKCRVPIIIDRSLKIDNI